MKKEMQKKNDGSRRTRGAAQRNTKNKMNGRADSVENAESTKGNGSSYKAGESGTAIHNIIGNSANIAIRNIAGDGVTLSVGGNMSHKTTGPDFTVPGVVAVGWVPTIGVPNADRKDAINLAARNIWMNLRSLYSNKIPYTAGAIVYYLLALDSVMTMFAFIKRAYSIVYSYDARNRYVPDGLLAAMGLDPDDFAANLPEVKVYLNEVAAIMTSFGIPTSISYIRDHMELTSNIYVDGGTSGSQYIVPSPAKLYKFDWDKNTMDLIPISTAAKQKWLVMKSRCDSLLQAFVNYEDVYMIAADMQRMYSTLAGIQPVDDFVEISPVYDPDFLTMFHNATLPDGNLTDALWHVSEVNAADNVGALKVAYATAQAQDGTLKSYNGSACLTAGVLDFHTSDPSIEDVLNACKWKYVMSLIWNGSTTAAPKIQMLSCGTSLISYVRIFYADQSTGGFSSVDVKATWFAINDKAWADPKTFDILKLSEYPIAYPSTITADAAESFPITFGKPIGDLDQYYSVTVSELQKIQRAYLMDRFDVAGIGTLNLSKK